MKKDAQQVTTSKIRVINTSACIDEIEKFFDPIIASCHFPDMEDYKITLAINEAITNIIEHGYPGKKGPIEIEAQIVTSSLTIIIRDWSEPYNLAEHFKINVYQNIKSGKHKGFGIFMMRNIMDEIEYNREAGQNKLTLVKHRKVAYKKDIQGWIASYQHLSPEEFSEIFPHPFLLANNFEQQMVKQDSLRTKTFRTARIKNGRFMNIKETKLPEYSQVRPVKKIKDYYPQKITIGRTFANDIQLENEEVSRFHAYIHNQQGQYYLTDATSTNGTWLNQQKLKPLISTPLNEHDIILLGKLIQLKFFSSVAFHSYMMFYKKHGCD